MLRSTPFIRLLLTGIFVLTACLLPGCKGEIPQGKVVRARGPRIASPDATGDQGSALVQGEQAFAFSSLLFIPSTVLILWLRQPRSNLANQAHAQGQPTP